MTNQPFAEVFPVHEHLADELEARGWMPADLAGAMGTAEEVVASLLHGELVLSDEVAIQLGDALGDLSCVLA